MFCSEGLNRSSTVKVSTINYNLATFAERTHRGFLAEMWKALRDCIDLNSAEVTLLPLSAAPFSCPFDFCIRTMYLQVGTFVPWYAYKSRSPCRYIHTSPTLTRAPTLMPCGQRSYLTDRLSVGRGGNEFRMRGEVTTFRCSK